MTVVKVFLFLQPKVDTLIPTGSNAEIDAIKTEITDVKEEVTNINLRVIICI